jgi:prophage DNA circulation protein
MAWAKTLLAASFRGVAFEVASTNDDIERSVVSNEYPFVDGANVRDMGRKGNRISMTAVFYGDDYESRLQKFLKVLDIPGSGELIHPIFGSLQAQFVRTSIPHDALLPDQTKISLEFLEDKLRAPLFDRVLPVQQVEAINKAADAALIASKNQFKIDIGKCLSLPSILRDKLSADMLSVMGTMRGYCDQLLEARSWVASGLFYLNNPLAFFDDLTDGLISRIQAIFSPIDLRIGSDDSSDAIPGYTNIGIAAVWSAPLADITRALLTPTLAQDGPATQPFLITHIAIQQAIAVAGCAAQIYDKALSAAALTPTDIETIAGDARTAISDTIALVRATYPDMVQSRPITEPLKMLALAVTQAAEKLIHAKPALIDRLVETPGNLQLLAHLWYGDYHRADEMLRLNPQVRNPNFITSGSTLRVYAA